MDTIATKPLHQPYQEASGQPLEAGYLYFGGENLNPETNPISIYWDAAGTQPAAQPVRTIGGMTVRNGAIAQVYAAVNYSITVKDRNGVLIYSEASSAQSITAAVIGYIQAGVGAILQTVQSVLRRTVWAEDYGFSTTATAAVNKAAILAAITYLKTVNGGTIRAGRGSFNVAGDIPFDADNLVFEGATPSSTYGEVTCATQLNFTSGTYGFGLTFIDGGGGGSYGAVRNVGIKGTGVLATGINIDGIVKIDNVQVSGCTAQGILMSGAINSTRLKNVTCVANVGGTGYGIYVKQTTNNNTAFSMDGVICRGNTIGMRIENALHASFRDCVMESNTAEGLIIYKPTGGNLGWLQFDNLWVEANQGGTSNYQVLIDSQTHDLGSGGSGFLTFNNCFINGTGTTRHLHIACCRVFDFYNLNCGGGDLANAILFDVNAYRGHLTNPEGGTITNNGTLCYSEVTQTIDFSGGLSGGPNIPTIYLNQVKFPATQVPSSAANALDDYEEGDWTPVDASGAALVLVVTYAKYTKIGNVVSINCKFAYPVTADVTAASTGGLPFTTINTAQQGIGLVTTVAAGQRLLLGAAVTTMTWNFFTAVTNTTLSNSTNFVHGTYFTN